MKGNSIQKDVSALRVQPNLTDYSLAPPQFDWKEIRRVLAGLPGGGFNIGYEAVDQQVLNGNGGRIAIRWRGHGSELKSYTYADLQKLTNRFGNVLRTYGIAKGDSVFLLLGRVPELYFSVLGAFKNGSVVTPLFSAFGQDPILNRMVQAKGKVLVTTESLYKKKVAPIRDRLPDLKLVLLVRDRVNQTLSADCCDYWSEMQKTSVEFLTEPTSKDDIALIHFTSGTTGTPKGAVHAHEAALMHYMTGKYALDLHEGDIFWCTADPGWVTGTSYGIIAPLLHGVTCVVDEAEFDPERWYEILAKEKVSVWYTAPTAIRMLMKAGPELPRKYDLSTLRLIASVGEPLNPEAVWWGAEILKNPIHDNWWQTETGGIMIANFPAMDIKPGSMGKPLPGVEAFIVQKTSEGAIEIIDKPLVQGELALKAGWPSMFRGYLNQEKRFKACFSDDLYLTGDLAKKDEDGYFWFVGRADDVIKSAGHLIGPFEVESALMEHPAVAEAGVIGKPDPIAGEVVKAFISLKTGFTKTEEIRLEILGFVRKRLGAAIAPKELEIIDSLPKTRSGKIMRRLVKARELGLPEGDTSTLESS